LRDTESSRTIDVQMRFDDSDGGRITTRKVPLVRPPTMKSGVVAGTTNSPAIQVRQDDNMQTRDSAHLHLDDGPSRPKKVSSHELPLRYG